MVRLIGVGPKSRTQSPRNTKIGRKIAHPTGNIAHLFQGQKVKGQGQQGDRKCIISTKREGLRTLKLVRRQSICYQLPQPAMKAYEVGFLHAGGGIPCRPNPAATQLVPGALLTI